MPAISRVQQINRLHQQFEAGLRTQRDIGIQLGKLLTEQKREVKAKGDKWEDWLKVNTKIPERTASRWMKWYKDQEQLKTATVAVLATTIGKTYAAPQKRQNEPDGSTAGKPPKEREVPLTLTEAQAEDFNTWVDKLGQWFHTNSTEDTILAALRFAYEELINGENNLATNRVPVSMAKGSGKGKAVA